MTDTNAICCFCKAMVWFGLIKRLLVSPHYTMSHVRLVYIWLLKRGGAEVKLDRRNDIQS